MDGFDYTQEIIHGRLIAIMEYLKKYGRLTVLDMSEYLNVSQATIRRDLKELQKQGVIRRTHGGAVLNGISTTFEYQYHDKVAMMMDEKERIAIQAALEIEDGDAVFLDSGTTTYQIAQHLQERNPKNKQNKRNRYPQNTAITNPLENFRKSRNCGSF